MGRVEGVLREFGPMISGKLAALLEKKYAISNEAARKAVSRAMSPVQKLKVFPFNKNQVFCYLEEQYNTQAYRYSLYEALKTESISVSVIIHALENSNYIMRKSLLPVFSKSPIIHTVGHRLFERIMSDLIKQGVLVEADEEYIAVSPMYCGEDNNISYSRSEEQVEKIIVNDFVAWASKINIIAYNSAKIFPEEGSFAHFKWFATIPSYIIPLYDGAKQRPGFVVVDVLFKVNASVDDVMFFVEKVNIIRNFKGVPAFAPILLLNGVSNEALKYLKENKVVVGILSNIFDKSYSETLMNMYSVLRNTTAVLLKEPQKIERLINEIGKSEGRFNNAMGDLFECMVGLFFHRIGSKYCEMNKLIPNGKGVKYEMDVLVERDGKMLVIECKAYRGNVGKDYIEKWLSERIPTFRRFLSETYPDRKIEFSIWSLGGFDEQAEALLKNHKEGAKKYELTYYDKEGIYQFAKSKNDKTFCEQINKHFKEYGVDKILENE